MEAAGAVLVGALPPRVCSIADELDRYFAAARGDDETAPPPRWPGLDPAWAAAPWHALNWQRAWRQAEAAVLSPPDTPQAAPGAPPAASAP